MVDSCLRSVDLFQTPRSTASFDLPFYPKTMRYLGLVEKLRNLTMQSFGHVARCPSINLFASWARVGSLLSAWKGMRSCLKIYQKSLKAILG